MKTLVFFALLFSSGNLWAGKLDLDYIKPSPTKALAYTLVIPGGGFFYLSKASKAPDKWYQARGVLYFAATALVAASTVSQARQHSGMGVGLGLAGLFWLRVMEFGDVIEDAETDRYAEYKKLYER